MRKRIFLTLTEDQVDKVFDLVFEMAKTDDELWADICESAKRAWEIEMQESIGMGIPPYSPNP